MQKVRKGLFSRTGGRGFLGLTHRQVTRRGEVRTECPALEQPVTIGCYGRLTNPTAKGSGSISDYLDLLVTSFHGEMQSRVVWAPLIIPASITTITVSLHNSPIPIQDPGYNELLILLTEEH